MEHKEFEAAKQQMAAAARSVLEDIQAAGKLERAIIDAHKTAVIHQGEIYNQQRQIADDVLSEQRALLIRQMGEAAQSGDFEEMRRIKKLLAESSEPAESWVGD